MLMDCCCTDSPDATFDGSKYDASKVAKSEKIICPILKSLYINGDLQIDEDGLTSFEASSLAMRRLGIRDASLINLVHGGSGQVLDDRGRFDIFGMDGNINEHPVSSGIMEVETREERVAKFEELASFATDDGRIYALQAARIVAHYRAHPHDINRQASVPIPCCPKSKVGMPANYAFMRGFAFLGTFAGIIGCMGRTDGSGFLSRAFFSKYVTVEDLRGLYLDGRYPPGWEERHAVLGLFDFLFANSVLMSYCLLQLMCCFTPKPKTEAAMRLMV